MPKRIILIGADEPGLNGVLEYKRSHPDTEAVVLYPELNPLSEFSCMTLDRFLGHGIDFPENLRAYGIDTNKKIVRVRDNFNSQESELAYDVLIFASGSAPKQLDVPGEFLGGIFAVGDYEDAARLRAKEGVNVIVGNGMNVLMAASSLLTSQKGTIEVITRNGKSEDEPLSESLTTMVRHHLTELGVIFHDDDTLSAIEGKKKAERVVTDKQTIKDARVINASANVPVSYLAAEAGIELDQNGGIKVDASLRTSNPDIFACGSCASFVCPSCKHPIPGISIKNTERRQASVIASSLAGDSQDFTPPVFAYSIPLGDLRIAGAGLTLAQASKCGFSPMSATVVQFDRAHFMPDAELMTLELIFDSKTGRVLGIQGLGNSGDGLCGRISAVAAILASKPSVEDIANLEIAYSPPFASALDVLNTVGNVAENIMAGENEGINADEFDRIWDERENGECFFLDCREIGNAEPFIQRHPLHWNHIPQGEIARRITEIPQDRKIILLCNTGARSYEAQVTLKHAGFDDVANVDGGIAAIKQSGVKV